MIKAPMPYGIRTMRLSDIAQVAEIERTSFPTPWPTSAYEYEITHNRFAHYQVLTVRHGDEPVRIIGYSGFWMLADEAHISTIAVDKGWRQRGLGELLLLNLIRLAIAEKAGIVTLEVRKSNKVAQALYEKYRFEIVGERKRYYQGKEDALLMTAGDLGEEYRIFLKRTERALFARLDRQKLAIKI